MFQFRSISLHFFPYHMYRMNVCVYLLQLTVEKKIHAWMRRRQRQLCQTKHISNRRCCKRIDSMFVCGQFYMYFLCIECFSPCFSIFRLTLLQLRNFYLKKRERKSDGCIDHDNDNNYVFTLMIIKMKKKK